MCLIQRIMDEYEQDLRVLQEKHQQGMYNKIICLTSYSWREEYPYYGDFIALNSCLYTAVVSLLIQP